MNQIRHPSIALVIAAILACLYGGSVAITTQVPEDIITGILGGPLVMAFRTVLALLIFGTIAYLYITRRVVFRPHFRFAIPLMVIGLVAVLQLFNTNFFYAGLSGGLLWLLYLGSFFAAIGAVGREHGTQLLLAGIGIGASLLALLGLVEYLGMMQTEPGYRIFAGWINPNALAGAFVIGLPVTIALAVGAKGRMHFVMIAATALVMLALALTQSRGGQLAAGGGAVFTLFLLAVWVKPKKIALPGLAVLAGYVFALALRGMASGSATGAAGRIADAATQDHSAGFRRNLWQTSIELLQLSPSGFGAGSFQYVSAKPGLVTGTFFAHQSFLEFAVEFGVMALLALLALLFFWFIEVLRAPKSMTRQQNILRAGIIGAVAGTCAQSLIDSNLSYTGLGVLFFLLLGTGLLVSADGVTPEPWPVWVRQSKVIVVCALPIVGFLVLAYQESLKVSLVRAAESGESAKAQTLATSLEGFALQDDEAYQLLSSLGAGSDDQRLAYLESAAEYGPRPTYFRSIAALHAERGNYDLALQALDAGLGWDPNNLLILDQAMQLAIANSDRSAAVEFANRLLAVESTPYYQVRSIPEAVPTETAKARVFLANLSDSNARKKELLTGAVDIYKQYLDSTVPIVIRFSKANPPMRFSGQGLQEALDNLERAEEAAHLLATTAGELGDETAVREAVTAGDAFSSAASELSSGTSSGIGTTSGSR